METDETATPPAKQEMPHPSRGEILGNAVSNVPSDLKIILRYPVDHPDKLKKFALIVGSLVLLDKPITKFYQNHIETPLSGFKLPASPIKETTVNDGANGWLLVGVGGSYLGGLLFDDAKSQQAAVMSVKAMAYSVLISQLLLKSITGRKRPISWATNGKPDGTYTNNPYDFGHIHWPRPGADQYATAMPSFHFTMFFAVAKVYQKTYDNYLVPYSLATIGLASNIRGHKHWVSDMVAGALIGTAIGDVVSNDDLAAPDNVKVIPYLNKDGGGLQFSVNF